jgi:thioredoxin-related protein
MKSLIILNFVILFSCSLISQSKSGQSKAEKLTWNSFDAGIKKAQSSGKKVLIDVYADWCKWCKTMDTVTYVDSKIKEYLNKNYVLIKLDGESRDQLTYDGKKMSAAEFAQGMGVTGFPATLFLKSNGGAITMLPGYSEPKMFIQVLSFIGENHYENKKFDDYLKEKGYKQ